MFLNSKAAQGWSLCLWVKDFWDNFSHRFGAEGWGRGVHGEAKHSLHQQQPKLVIPGQGLLGCGREADTILLRTPAFLWAVLQKYQGETQFSSGPAYHRGWWEQSAGSALLSLRTDRFILYFWILASPPRTVVTSQKGGKNWIYLLHGSF